MNILRNRICPFQPNTSLLLAFLFHFVYLYRLDFSKEKEKEKSLRRRPEEKHDFWFYVQAYSVMKHFRHTHSMSTWECYGCFHFLSFSSLLPDRASFFLLPIEREIQQIIPIEFVTTPRDIWSCLINTRARVRERDGHLTTRKRTKRFDYTLVKKVSCDWLIQYNNEIRLNSNRRIEWKAE